MKLGVFVWTINRDYTLGRIPVDDTLGAMSTCLFKVNDGLEHQTYSPDDSRRWADEVYRPQGIEWKPWGVARGWSHDIAFEEGRLAGRHAAAAQSDYVLDLEPYPDEYWQGIPGTAAAFCTGYRETSNGRKLNICPDARNHGINLEEWTREDVVGYWYPQMYFRAYGESYDLWESNGIFPLINLGVPKSRIIPVLAAWLQTAGDPPVHQDDLEYDIMDTARRGYAGATIWRRGVMSNQQVERMLSMADPFATPPPPLPPPPPPAVGRETRIEPIGAPSTVVGWTEKDDERLIVTTQRVRLVRDA